MRAFGLPTRGADGLHEPPHLPTSPSLHRQGTRTFAHSAAVALEP